MSPSPGAAGTLHPTIRAAAAGELPSWTRAGPGRRAHMERVADLLASWAEVLGLAGADRVRWRAAGWLHDALRDAPPSSLTDLVPPEAADLPDALLHGPAAAARLRSEGVGDQDLLRAVAFHSVGHPDFEELGLATYCADFLEPGRSFLKRWRAGLRDRMPDELEAVAREIVAARIGHLLEEARWVDLRTVGLWNRLAGPQDGRSRPPEA